MSSIQPITFLLAIVVCCNGLHVAHAYRIRGRAVEAYASYPSPSTMAGASLSTTATFPTLVLPPDSHSTAFRPAGAAADSGTRPSLSTASSATATFFPVKVSVSFHRGLQGFSIDSNAVATTTPSSGLPPAFLSGLSAPLSRISGAAAVAPAVSGTTTANGIAFNQSDNVMAGWDPNCKTGSGQPCNVDVKPKYLAPKAVIAAFSLAARLSTLAILQQSASTHTESSQSAVTPALVKTPVPVQSQTDVRNGGAAVAAAILMPFQQQATPVISSVPSSFADVVGGPSLANNGLPAIISSQTARASGESIHVGTPTEPASQAQVPQATHHPDLVAGSLTLAALPSGPAAQIPPTPVVVGGPTFSAALTNTPVGTSAVPAEPNTAPNRVGQPTVVTVQPIDEPVQPNAAPAQPDGSPVPVPVDSNAALAQSNALTVVVAGVTYAPAQPGTQVAASAIAGSNIEVPSGAAGLTLGQPTALVAKQPDQERSRPVQQDRTLASANASPGQSSQIPAYKPQTQGKGDSPIVTNPGVSQTNNAAMVLGGITYTPVAAQYQVPETPILVGVVGGLTVHRQGSIAIVGSQTVTQGPATVSVQSTPVALGVIGSQTIIQGSAPIALDYTPVALGPSATVVGANTITLPPVNVAVTTPAVYSFGGVAVTQGGAPVTISGTEYSLGPSFVVEGTKTIPISSAAPSNPVLTIAGQTITANPTGFSIGGSSVSPNAPAITVLGTVVSLNPSAVIIGSSTKPFLGPAATSSVLTLGSHTFTALPASAGGGFLIDEATLLPGSSAIIISGTTYTLNSASSLVIGTSTIPLATASPKPGASNGMLTAGDVAFTPLDSTAVLVNDTTLFLSGPALTEDSTILSLASGGIVVDSSTYAFAVPASNAAVTTTGDAAMPSVFTIDGGTFTASGKGLAIDGTAVFQGSSAVTISGTPISLGPTGLMIGTSTVPLASVTRLGPPLSRNFTSTIPAPSAGSGTKASSGAASVGEESEMWMVMILWAAAMGFISICG